jgi:hypothetical protein
MRGYVRLSLIFLLGSIVGIWTFIEPWVIDYPFGAQHQWSPSVWSNAWVGGIVTGASLVGLVLAVAVGLRSAVGAQAGRRVEPEPAAQKLG